MSSPDDLSKLEQRFVGLAGKLEIAARELRRGSWPGLDDIVREAAQLKSMYDVISVSCGPVSSLAELREIRTRFVQLQRALEKIARLVHRGDSASPLIVAIRAQCDEFRGRVSDDIPASLVAGIPFVALADLVELGSSFDDETASSLAAIVAGHFGHAVSIAAVRGRFALSQADTVTDTSHRSTEGPTDSSDASPAILDLVYVDSGTDVAPTSITATQEIAASAAGGGATPHASPPIVDTAGELVIADADLAEKQHASAVSAASHEPQQPSPRSNRAADDIAPPVVSADRPGRSEIHHRFWQSLAAGHYALAFQILHAAGTPDLPPALIKALALSREINSSLGSIVNTLKSAFETFGGEVETWTGEEYRPANLLAAAASLRPALLAPDTGATVILRSLRIDPGLAVLTQTIARYGERLRGVDRFTLRGVGTLVEWESRRDALRAEANQLFDRASSRTFIFAQATDVWRALARPGGVVHELLSAVTSGDPDRIPRLAERLASLDLAKEVERTHHDIVPLRRRMIIGKAREQIHEHGNDVIAIATRWVELDRLRPVPGGFMERTINDLRQELNALSPGVAADLQRLASASDSATSIAALVLRRSYEDLQALFRDSAEPSARSDRRPESILGAELLRTDLLLSDSLEPLASREVVIREVLGLCDQPSDWVAAFRRRIDRGDFELGRQILEVVDPTDSDTLRATWHSELDGARASFRLQLMEVRSRLEQAVIHGLVSESERGEFDAKLVALEHELPRVLRFEQPLQDLQTMKDALDSRRNSRISSLEQRVRNARIEPEQSARIRQVLAHGDVLTAEEYLHMAERGALPAHDESAADTFRDFFPDRLREIETFFTEQPNAERVIRAVFAERRQFCGLDLKSLSPERAKQSAEMVTCWFELKGHRTFDEAQIRTILEYFGFPRVTVEARAGDKPRSLGIRTDVFDDRSQVLLDAYGSGARGQYRIIAAWDRPSEDEILGLVGDTSNQDPALFLYFGRLGEQQRRDLARLCLSRRTTVIVLDDIMIAYLATVPGRRQRALFKVTLPFTHYEPYLTTATLVAPEMFYGRERERDLIVQPTGPSFLYGGRQLGKTALLRHVERSYHAPDRGWVVRWIDLKAEQIGLHKPADELWQSLARDLRDTGVLGRMTGQIRPERVTDAIRTWLSDSPARRVLLLLDEADAFLRQDAEDGFRQTSMLKGLMDQTDRRFKVVFAGLHNVLRSTRLGNHPLAHFGEPVAIGPLIDGPDVRAAKALVEEPFGALGYYFQSVDLVFRILAQTNYYPSLIQLYGHHLLRHLGERLPRSARARDYPPYTITADHLEEAYGSRELREAIRQRFALTLQLDERYEVIAYALAYAMLERRLSLDEGASVEWLRSEAFSWWRDGFTDTPDDDFRVLLDEMVSLGVFRSLDAARFTFRNANTLLLLGTEGEVATVLVRDRQRPPVFDAATFREPLRARPNRLSVLTARQASLLRDRRNGLSIASGSAATGLHDLEDSLRELVGDEFFKTLPDIHDRATFAGALDRLADRAADGTTLVYIPATCAWSVAWIADAAGRLKRLWSNNRFVRLVFAAGPETMLQFDQEALNTLDQLGVDTVALTPWHDAAVRYWLETNHLPNESALRIRLRTLTGNRPLLLYRFLDATRNYAHWEQAARQTELEVASGREQQERLRLLGLHTDHSATQVIRHIALLEKDDQPVEEHDLERALHDSQIDVSLIPILRWAESQQLIGRAGEISWRVDPWVAEILLEE